MDPTTSRGQGPAPLDQAVTLEPASGSGHEPGANDHQLVIDTIRQLQERVTSMEGGARDLKSLVVQVATAIASERAAQGLHTENLDRFITDVLAELETGSSALSPSLLT